MQTIDISPKYKRLLCVITFSLLFIITNYVVCTNDDYGIRLFFCVFGMLLSFVELYTSYDRATIFNIAFYAICVAFLSFLFTFLIELSKVFSPKH